MTWTTLATTTRKAPYFVCLLTPVCFDILCTTSCQWTVKLVQHGESSGMKTRRFRSSSCFWSEFSAGRDLSHQGCFMGIYYQFTRVIHPPGTRSMRAQSWQCATMTYLRWRTTTVLWPSRSCLFLSATFLPMWILKPSNRSDRWDTQVEFWLWQAWWVLSISYSALSLTNILIWTIFEQMSSKLTYFFIFPGNYHPHPGHRHGQTWRDTRLL